MAENAENGLKCWKVACYFKKIIKWLMVTNDYSVVAAFNAVRTRRDPDDTTEEEEEEDSSTDSEVEAKRVKLDPEYVPSALTSSCSNTAASHDEDEEEEEKKDEDRGGRTERERIM
jgi:hypothetical protein